MDFSDWESSAEVASSKIRMQGFFSDALFLAARQFQAALADLGVVAVGETHDEIMDVRGTGGVFDSFFAGIGLAISDVVENRVVKQHRVLRDDGNGGA